MHQSVASQIIPIRQEIIIPIYAKARDYLYAAAIHHEFGVSVRYANSGETPFSPSNEDLVYAGSLIGLNPRDLRLTIQTGVLDPVIEDGRLSPLEKAMKVAKFYDEVPP